MRSPSVSWSLAFCLACLALSGCVEDVDYASRVAHINWDGGTPYLENGKKVACNASIGAGCCMGNTVGFCKNGYYHVASCGGNPSCGWSAALKHYACGTSGNPDPSGQKPMSCDPDGGTPPPADGPSYPPPPEFGAPEGGGTGPGCGTLPTKGCCRGSVLDWCDNGNMRSTDCKNKPSCGWNASQGKYACGTSGGSDPSGTHQKTCGGGPTDGGPPPPPPEGGVPPPDGGGGGTCGKIPPQGCCNNKMLDYCDNGNIRTTDCKNKPSCGWNNAQKKYGCGTSGGSDPGGKFPKSCTAYLPDIGTPPPVGDGAVPPGDGQTPPPVGDGSPPPPTGDGPTPPPLGDASPPPPVGDGPPPPGDGGVVSNCYKLTVVGCCRGDQLDYCKSGQMTTTSCTGKPKCGWNMSQKKYGCGTSGGSDPAGKFPKSCTAYLPDIGTPPPVGDGAPPPVGDGPPPPVGDGSPPPVGDGPPPPVGDGLPPPVSDGPKPPTDGPKPPTDGKPKDDAKKPPSDGPGPSDDASKQDKGKPIGTEGGPCYGNNTCNQGLKCLSGVCVKVPGADAYIPPNTNKRDETGCECSTASGPASAWPLLLLALGLVISRRRRSGHA